MRYDDEHVPRLLRFARRSNALLHRAVGNFSYFPTHIANRIYSAAQADAVLLRALHVLLNAVPDIAFALLALAGLSYLLPEPVRRLEQRRGSRFFLICFFSAFGLFAIIVNAINREEQSHNERVATDKLGAVQSTLQVVEQALLQHNAGSMSEAERREQLSSSLRAEYILNHDPIDPAILAGSEMPPEAWMNERLRQLGESWSVSAPVRTKLRTEERSYVQFIGQPRFAGSTTPTVEGGQFKVGDPLGFNVHYKVAGRHPVTLVKVYMQAFFEKDGDASSQRLAISGFKVSFRDNPSLKLTSRPTLNPEDDRFNTAFVLLEPNVIKRTQQSDLDEMQSVTAIVYVVAEVDYLDEGALHHARECLLLQPPATPPGIWQYCKYFNSSA